MRISGLLSATFFLIVFSLSSAHANSLSNKAVPFVDNHLSVAFLSSEPVDHKTQREIDSLATRLQGAVTLAKRMKLHWDRSIHIRIWEDTSFPVSDLWKAAGLEPDGSEFSNLKKCLESLFQVTTPSEQNLLRLQLQKRYPFLAYYPYPTLPPTSNDSSLQEPDDYDASNTINEYIQTLKDTIHRPLSEMTTYYYFTPVDSYNCAYSTVWVARESRSYNLHREYDTIFHETGHHLFMELSRQRCNELLPEAPLSDEAVHGILQPLAPVNELFADYFSVASGHNIVRKVHEYSFTLPDEFKRYFSKERSLVEFINEANNAGTLQSHFLNSHNILNPSRYFLWILRLDLDADTANTLFVQAAKCWIDSFLNTDIHSYTRVEDEYVPGSFCLENYPSDIASVNLRFLQEITSLPSPLTEKQLLKFNKAVDKVFGNMAPPQTIR